MLGAPPAAGAQPVSIGHRGITVNGMLALAPGRSPADGIVLMLHGTMAHYDMEIMRRFRGMFADNGYSTLAVNFGLEVDDRRGFHDCSRPSTHRKADALDEIGAWLDWLQARGARRVVVFGFSRGGQQAAWFAAERDHPAIASLVLLAPVNPGESAQPARYEAQFGRALSPVIERARTLVAAGRGAARLERVAFLNCAETTVSAEAFLSYYAPDPAIEMPALLSRVKKPAFVLVAGEDSIVRHLDRQLAPLVDGRRLRMAVISGSDHFFRDLYGEDAMDEILGYLRQSPEVTPLR